MFMKKKDKKLIRSRSVSEKINTTALTEVIYFLSKSKKDYE